MSDEQAKAYVKKVLLMNATVDLLVGLALVFLSPQLGAVMGFPEMDAIVYLSGGWGMGTIAFAGIRFAAVKHPESYWLMVWFGLFEGGTLLIYCIGIQLLTSISLLQAALPMGIAIIFTIAYGVAYRMPK